MVLYLNGQFKNVINIFMIFINLLLIMLNKKQDDFGCGFMQLYPSKGGLVEGSFNCGKNFSNQGVLRVTGTMTRVQ